MDKKERVLKRIQGKTKGEEGHGRLSATMKKSIQPNEERKKDYPGRTCLNEKEERPATAHAKESPKENKKIIPESIYKRDSRLIQREGFG